MKIPKSIQTIMERITNAGYHVYLVGGCVRDDLLHREIHDYDMTSDALPEVIISLFSDYPLVKSGLKHGTVGIVNHHQVIEITTHRKQETYENHRHPNHLEFTTSLSEDLVRRDFTINAMAMDLDGNLYDEHGGQKDLKNKLIRCVGDPYQRFEEDALRMMRCVRFSMQLGFTIEPNTLEALKKSVYLLKYISKERIREEFHLMLLSDADHLLQTLYNIGILSIIFPVLSNMVNVSQDSPWHIYDLFTHTDIALNHTKGDSLSVKLAICYHDIGKLYTRTFDEEKQVAHYPNHATISVKETKSILKEYHYSKKQIKRILSLIALHDDYLKDDVLFLKKLIAKLDFDYELMNEIAEVQLADNSAKNCDMIKHTVEMIHQAKKMIHALQDTFHPILAIDGNDLLSLGYRGVEIGNTKQLLMNLIIENPDTNTKENLITYLKQQKMHP